MKRVFALFGIVLLCSLLLIPHVIAERMSSLSEYVLKIYGNANEDDIIDMRDVTYIKLVIFGKKPSTEFCDANYDGKVSMLDVVQTKLIIIEKAGKLTVIDALNRTETLEMPIERVVITFNVEEYLAVGMEEALRKVVGWSKYYWEGRRPTVWETYLERFPWIDDITYRMLDTRGKAHLAQKR